MKKKQMMNKQMPVHVMPDGPMMPGATHKGGKKPAKKGKGGGKRG